MESKIQLQKQPIFLRSNTVKKKIKQYEQSLFQQIDSSKIITDQLLRFPSSQKLQTNTSATKLTKRNSRDILDIEQIRNDRTPSARSRKEEVIDEENGSKNEEDVIDKEIANRNKDQTNNESSLPLISPGMNSPSQKSGSGISSSTLGRKYLGQQDRNDDLMRNLTDSVKKSSITKNHKTVVNKQKLISSIYFPKSSSFRSEYDNMKDELIDPMHMKKLLQLTEHQLKSEEMSDQKVGTYHPQNNNQPKIKPRQTTSHELTNLINSKMKQVEDSGLPTILETKPQETTNKRTVTRKKSSSNTTKTKYRASKSEANKKEPEKSAMKKKEKEKEMIDNGYTTKSVRFIDDKNENKNNTNSTFNHISYDNDEKIDKNDKKEDIKDVDKEINDSNNKVIKGNDNHEIAK